MLTLVLHNVIGLPRAVVGDISSWYKEFTAYFNWTGEDQLFHLRASLRGLVGQLLWYPGLSIMLVAFPSAI